MTDNSNALLKPQELSLDEFNGLLEQLRTELTAADASIELVDAARHNDGDVVRAILTVYPIIINEAKDDHDNTPLHMAAANGHVDMVSLLLQCGADPSMRNEKGNTPLHWAASNGQQAVVNALLKHEKVDVLQRNSFGRSALTEGFTSQNTDIVQSLLEHDTATEERLMQTGGNEDGDAEMTESDNEGVTHEFQFGHGNNTTTTVPIIRIRELPIAKTDQESILGQANPSDDTTGLGIWAASLVTAQWMVALSTASSHKNHFAGTVVELGAGCGVPSLAIAAANPSTCQSLYATDFNPKTVDNLRYNIDLNNNNDGCAGGGAGERVKALEMNWQDPSTWPNEPVSLVVGSDLIYQSDMVPLLVQTVQGLLRPGGTFLYVAPSTGRQGQDEFFQLMASKQFTYQEHAMQESFRANPLASQDDDLCFVHFHELRSADFRLYEFTKPEA